MSPIDVRAHNILFQHRKSFPTLLELALPLVYRNTVSLCSYTEHSQHVPKLHLGHESLAE